MKIGLAISTHNRPYHVLHRVVNYWKYFLSSIPNVIVVVDDASRQVVKGSTYRFNRNVGIAATKNKCIELLYDAGCTDIFLSDDDLHPTSIHGINNYIQSNFDHLCLSFNKGETEPVGEYAGHNVYNHINGCLLYMTREVIDTVGGMRTEFGRWGCEHIEFSNRVFNAGLTPHPYMDVKDNMINFYSYDYHNAIQGSVPEHIRRQMSARNTILLDQYKDSKDYVNFR